MNIDRDELLLFALDQLSPGRKADIAAALDADPALQGELQSDLEALGLLLDDLDLAAVTVPADAESRLLARIHAGGQVTGSSTDDLANVQPVTATPGKTSLVPSAAAKRPLWWLALPLGAAAALALFFALRTPADPLQHYAQTPGAVTKTVTASGQSLGQLVQLPGGRVFIRLEQPLATGRTYQLWQIQAGKPVSLGVFDQSGTLTEPLPPGATLAVSVEPAGGSAQPTTKPLFAQSL